MAGHRHLRVFTVGAGLEGDAGEGGERELPARVVVAVDRHRKVLCARCWPTGAILRWDIETVCVVVRLAGPVGAALFQSFEPPARNALPCPLEVLNRSFRHVANVVPRGVATDHTHTNTSTE